MNAKRVVRAAVELFHAFRDRPPRRAGTVNFDVPEMVVIIGHVEEICYRTTHDDKAVRYRHPFQKGSRPLLAVSHDGKQLLLLGGRYLFTGRGIVDKDARGRLVFDPKHGTDDGFLRRRQAD